LVGRLPVVTTLEDLDEASLKLILTEPKNALLKQYRQLFEMEGVDLTVAWPLCSLYSPKADIRCARDPTSVLNAQSWRLIIAWLEVRVFPAPATQF